MTILSSHEYLPDATFPFTISRYVISANEVISEHSHEFVELVFVESGNALHRLAGQSFSVAPGDVFVIEPAVYHSYQGSGSGPTVVYNVLFSTEFIQNDLRSLMDISSFVDLFYLAPFLRRTQGFVARASLTETESSRLLRYLADLLAEITDQESGYQLASKTVLIHMLIFLSRCYEKQSQGERRAQRDRMDPSMETIMAFVRDNHTSPLRVKHISHLFGIGTSTLLTRFKEHTGMTLLQYKHQIQIQEACRLLAETEERIADISQAVGFDDLSFFYRIFRRKTGLSPGKYRLKLRA